MEGYAPKFGLCVLIPKDDLETIDRINNATEKAMMIGEELWEGVALENFKVPLRDGDVKRPDKPEFAGGFIMNRGWVKNYRKELKSDVWVMPPLYARVWQFLMLSANFEERKVPMRDGSFIVVRPGQHLTSVRTIANAVGWYERGIWKETNPKTILDILDWLEKQNMITLEHGNGNRQFTLISLVNWELYQGEHDSEEIPSEDEGISEVSEDNQMLDLCQ